MERTQRVINLVRDLMLIYNNNKHSYLQLKNSTIKTLQEPLLTITSFLSITQVELIRIELMKIVKISMNLRMKKRRKKNVLKRMAMKN